MNREWRWWRWRPLWWFRARWALQDARRAFAARVVCPRFGHRWQGDDADVSASGRIRQHYTCARCLAHRSEVL